MRERNKRIWIRMTDKEYADLEEKRKKSGYPQETVSVPGTCG